MSESIRASPIPKITHQIWFQGWAQLPAKYHDNVNKISSMNRDWHHMKWDEQQLRLECQKLGEPYLKKFDSFDQMILKIDYGRYVVLYNYGGISVDTDMTPLKSFNAIPEIDTSDFIVSESSFPANMFGLKNNAVFCVRKGHPIMKEIIDTITRSTKTKDDYLLKELQTQNETGPQLVTSVLEQHVSSITVLKHTYFEPCDSADMFCKLPAEAILDHKHAQSWVASPITTLISIFFFILHYRIWFGLLLAILIVWFFAPNSLRFISGRRRGRA